MEALLPILTEGAKVLGVPMIICMALAGFVIRDHSRRIRALEELVNAAGDKQALELNKIYDRINTMAEDVAFIKGRMSKGKSASQGEKFNELLE